jgi:hypothetical protein
MVLGFLLCGAGAGLALFGVYLCWVVLSELLRGLWKGVRRNKEVDDGEGGDCADGP